MDDPERMMAAAANDYRLASSWFRRLFPSSSLSLECSARATVKINVTPTHPRQFLIVFHPLITTGTAARRFADRGCIRHGLFSQPVVGWLRQSRFSCLCTPSPATQ